MVRLVEITLEHHVPLFVEVRAGGWYRCTSKLYIPSQECLAEVRTQKDVDNPHFHAVELAVQDTAADIMQNASYL